MDGTYSFNDLCAAVGKGPMYVKNLQRALGLPILRDGRRYRDGYVRFVEKAVALRTFCVSIERIADLFEIEKKLLRMLHIDSLSAAEDWYLDACGGAQSPNRLLLTGHDVGFVLAPDGPGHVQDHLDFIERDPELFTGAEMGEDIRVVVRKYLDQVAEIRALVEHETPVLRDALSWAAEAFGAARRRLARP